MPILRNSIHILEPRQNKPRKYRPQCECVEFAVLDSFNLEPTAHARLVYVRTITAISGM
ncbi:hypothetical protein KIN20_022490 [Parelaphostrongylus tenuis]|uniref:Uncharacterized protein n=1 Tax=Parelaphostrongylus tenuis TaxID=148309 RepID=A0AAD5MQP2_PARTN|nr:hypothetical protein KIN20_022490 [Parelaphostrongylus tenuis]